ncbi:hypothetical protein Hanom_Chr08g00707491 [Helianthus anomalus]
MSKVLVVGTSDIFDPFTYKRNDLSGLVRALSQAGQTKVYCKKGNGSNGLKVPQTAKSVFLMHATPHYHLFTALDCFRRKHK